MKPTAKTWYLIATVAGYLTAALCILLGYLLFSLMYFCLGLSMLALYLQSKDKK